METGYAPETAAPESEERLRQPLYPRHVPVGYYGLPAVKHSHYRWTIGASFFAAGMAGALEVLTTVLDLTGRGGERRLLRTGRYVALAGSLASPLLYIKDLGTPSRWFNMLRIFRPTSLMSVGSWSLSALGALTGVTALGQLLEDLGCRTAGSAVSRMSSLLALPAAMVVTPYMGSELEETSTPFWASSTPLLPALFVVSNMSNGLSVLELSARSGPGQRPVAKSITALALALGISELMLLKRLEARWVETEEYGLRRLGQALLRRTGSIAVARLAAVALRGASLLRTRLPAGLLPAASLITLATGFFLPPILLFAGNRSADRPRDYFSFTTPTDRSAVGGATATGAGPRPLPRAQKRKKSRLATWVLLGCAAAAACAIVAGITGPRQRGGEELPYELAAA